MAISETEVPSPRVLYSGEAYRKGTAMQRGQRVALTADESATLLRHRPIVWTRYSGTSIGACGMVPQSTYVPTR